MLQGKIYTIGRGAECDIRLDDLSVSQVHAEVQLLADGKLAITDRNSTNGSFFFDGSQWREFVRATVNPTAHIRFGNCERVASQLVVAPKAAETWDRGREPLYAPPAQPLPHGSVDLKWLFFSFEGRINRKYIWLFGVGTSLVGLLATVLDAAAGGGISFRLLFNLLLLWPNFAMGVKRSNDRNRPGWFFPVFFGSMMAWVWIGMLSFPEIFSPTPTLSPSFINLYFIIWLLMGMVVSLAALWMFVEVFCLRGTVGPNRFGQDPLQQLPQQGTLAAILRGFKDLWHTR